MSWTGWPHFLVDKPAVDRTLENILLGVAGLACVVAIYLLARRSRAQPVEAPRALPSRAQPAAALLPKISYDEDVSADAEGTLLGLDALALPTNRIVYDEEAAVDEPTHPGALILVTATAQSHTGLRRTRNEDSVLIDERHSLFVVADGMGGYRGGEVASQLAVTTIERAFTTATFAGSPATQELPRPANELVTAIQMANEAIHTRAGSDKQLQGMGTTICAARFSANKQRLYVGHVGDSRIYCLRSGTLRQMTSDHTMQQTLGMTGDASQHLSRAVGVWPRVPIDIVLGKPRPGDVYLLCSDGLNKMVDDATIRRILTDERVPSVAATQLIEAANERGGKDNVTVIVVRVDDPVADGRPRAAA